MCCRYTLNSSSERIKSIFDAHVAALLQPRFNIAPSQPVPVIRQRGGRVIDLVQWGLVPWWAKDVSLGQKLANARSETAHEKPAFRDAMKYRRCLLPADGFYEWQKAPQKSQPKQPYLFAMADEQPFAFAGLWEHYQDAHGNELETCTILTTDANAMMQPIHPRMPVILEPQDYDRWLDPKTQDPAQVQSLLHPFDSDRMMYHPVSTRVNNPRHEGPALTQSVRTSLFD